MTVAGCGRLGRRPQPYRSSMMPGYGDHAAYAGDSCHPIQCKAATKTASSPSIFRMKPPTFNCWAMERRLSNWCWHSSYLLGFQLKHRATCDGGGCLTRHSHYVRVRLGEVSIWWLQCTTCKAVFTVLPHFVLRYRRMRPEVARDALLATHGGLRLELCAVLYPISPRALYRLRRGVGSLLWCVRCPVGHGREALVGTDNPCCPASPTVMRPMYSASRRI
jgi:hypothetical protein